MKTVSAQPSVMLRLDVGGERPGNQGHQVGEEDEARRPAHDGKVALGALGPHHVLGDAVEVSDERLHERAERELVVGDHRASTSASVARVRSARNMTNRMTSSDVMNRLEATPRGVVLSDERKADVVARSPAGQGTGEEVRQKRGVLGHPLAASF